MRKARSMPLAALLLLGAALLAARARAGDDWPPPDPDGRVGVSAIFEPATAAPGATVTLTVRIRTAPGWHIYSMGEKESLPTSLTLDLPEAWSLAGGWKEPPPTPFVMQGSQKPVLVHEGRIPLRAEVRLPEGLAPGSHEVHGTLRYMACDARTCLPPASLPFAATLKVAAARAKGGTSPAGPAIAIDPASNFGVAAELRPARVAPGGTVMLRLHVEVAPSWHIYARTDTKNYPARIEVPDLPEGISFAEGSDWSGPEPESFLQADGTVALVHEGRVVFERTIRIDSGAKAGEVTLAGLLKAMACDPRTCKPPGALPFRATLTVDADAGAGVPLAGGSSSAPAAGADATAGAGGSPVGGGMLKLVVYAILGAMISWIMPCVYPMIPIIISFFGKLAEEKKTARTGVAVSYGIGIAGTFISIGLVVGLLTLFVVDASRRSGLASLGNTIATNPWLNLVIGGVFVAFALSMFGLFTIQVPSRLISKTDRAGRASGSAHVGGVLLGITFALASFTCTVPVVGFLLGLAASGTASGFLSSIVGMVVYGVVFAFPFVLLSLFPGFLSTMPKAGRWMETIKIGFGFLELAVAIKFLWVPDLEWGIGLLTRPVVLALLGLIVLGAAGFFLGLVRVGHGCTGRGTRTRPFAVGPGRWIAALATLAVLVPVGLFLASPPAYKNGAVPGWVAIGMEAILPPAPAGDDLARLEGWIIDDYDAALAEARRRNKPMFIDFTGVYCGNCRAMEQKVFPQPPVPERFHEMVLARLYVDRPEEKHKRFARMQVERYGLASQPYYVVLDPNDEQALAKGGGFMGHSRFVALLDRGLARFAEKRGKLATTR